MNKTCFFFLISIFGVITTGPIIHVCGSKKSNIELIRPVYCNNKALADNQGQFFSELEKATQFTMPVFLRILEDKSPSPSTNPVIFLKGNDSERDNDNKHVDDSFYVLKYYKNELYGEDKAIREAVGAHVGASMAIPINKVRIISKNKTFFGKEDSCFNLCVATIHTGLVGIEGSKIGLNAPNIREGLAGKWCLKGIVEHEDLCDIVALDIVLNNNDRHKGNYMCDQQKEKVRYYPFDMDKIFESDEKHENVAYKSIRFLETYLLDQQYPRVLTEDEKRALRRVNFMIKRFKFIYSEQKLYEVWMQKEREAEHVYSKEEKEAIKGKIHKNNKYVKKLIVLIDRLIAS